MLIEHPKSATQSITLAKAKLIKVVSLAVVAINTLGIPAILNLVPPRHQIHATAALLVIEGAGTVLSINGTEQITQERLRRGTLWTAEGQAGPNMGEAMTSIALDSSQLQRFMAVRPYVELAIDIVKPKTIPESEQERISRLLAENFKEDL